MKSKITFKLTEEETALVQNFCRQVDMDKSTVAKRALFMVMNSAYSQAKQLMENQANDTVSGNPEGNLAGESSSMQAGDSNVSTDSGEAAPDSSGSV